MKFFSPIFFILFTITTTAQSVFIAEKGEATFYSYALLEDINAISKQVNSMINTVNGEVAFMIPMRSFRFVKSLMEEHFNDKYMESEKYPQATFKGKINDQVDFSENGTYNVSAIGKLTIHGKEKEIEEDATIVVNEGRITLTTELFVALEDYNIKKPQLLFNNIADTIQVKIRAEYVPFRKK